MKNVRILKINDMIQDVDKIDALIALHQNLSDDHFMTEQYLARKERLIKKLTRAFNKMRV